MQLPIGPTKCQPNHLFSISEEEYAAIFIAKLIVMTFFIEKHLMFGKSTKHITDRQRAINKTDRNPLTFPSSGFRVERNPLRYPYVRFYSQM